MRYKGTQYSSFKGLWRAVEQKTETGEVTASAHLRKRLAQEPVSDQLLDECLLLNASAYREIHGRRKTWIILDGKHIEAKQLFDTLNRPGSEPLVVYSTFRQRLKSLERRKKTITWHRAEDAAFLSIKDWKTFYGGGRRKDFVYDGDLFPDARGDYPSFTAFLKTIGRYSDRGFLKRRLAAHWEVDDLLREPVTGSATCGYIYRLTDQTTGHSYIGLSVNPPEVRFGQHKRSARNGSSTLLHQAIRDSGEASFSLDVLEAVEGDDKAIAVREVFWIAKLGTVHPDGLNTLTGGQIGRYDGMAVRYESRDYPSIAAMARLLSAETGLAEHVILQRWRDARPLSKKARTQSDHPDAGTPPYRQWLGIKKRAAKPGVGIDKAWEDYDTWKKDIERVGGNGRLTRKDENLPWGPENVVRMEHGEIMRRTHGRSFSAFGRSWPTKQAALDEHGVPRNTFDHRIASGMTVENALRTPLGPTSKKVFRFEGEVFPSRNNACEVLSERFGMTPHQVKDRLVRRIPSELWP